MSSEAQRRAVAKWDAENAEKITIKLHKGVDPSKEQIQTAAARDGVSVNRWIIDCIRDKL